VWTDEAIFLGAAHEVVEGRSPYAHPVYNYPPLLAEAGALAVRGLGDRGFLTAVRLLDLAATVALAWFAAGWAPVGWRGRTAIALAWVVASPLVHQAFEFGNVTPVVAALAIAGWWTGRRRPWTSGWALAASVALKPVAAVGAVFVSLEELVAHRSWRRRLAAAAWIPLCALLLLPGGRHLPELVGRMAAPPFQPYHASIRRVAAGFGVNLPAAVVAAAVLAAALVWGRRRPLDGRRRVLVAPVVALAALPVVWGHTFLLTAPLQVAALARAIDRRRARPPARWVEAAWVATAVAAIQGAPAIGVLAGWPPAAQALVALVPTVAPLALAAYVLRTEPEP
jgi:hypothetical protein